MSCCMYIASVSLLNLNSFRGFAILTLNGIWWYVYKLKCFFIRPDLCMYNELAVAYEEFAMKSDCSGEHVISHILGANQIHDRNSWLYHWALLKTGADKLYKEIVFYSHGYQLVHLVAREKRGKIWHNLMTKALYQQKNEKRKVTTQNATKTFDYTAIADRLVGRSVGVTTDVQLSLLTGLRAQPSHSTKQLC